MKCACGRATLCGYTDKERTVFACAICYDDDTRGHDTPGRRFARKRSPRFRTPEERKKILESYPYDTATPRSR
jgi:hypothetical protein